jgi:poly(3-hydroxyalkanoate) synthetase
LQSKENWLRTIRKGHHVKQLSRLSLIVFALFPLFESQAAQPGQIVRDLHWVVNREKFELAVERLQKDKGTTQNWPIIMSHGLLVNDSFLNLDEDRSLARYLAQQGFDVWNLSFRGNGRSLAPLKDPPRSWNLDAFVEQDIPEVVRYVLKESKSSRVAWIGYELGGMLAYASLGQKPDRSVAALVTIAAPLTFNEPEQSALKKLLGLNDHPRLKHLLLYMNTPLLMRLLVPLVPGIEKLFYNSDNMDEEVKEKLLDEALAVINPGVLDHLLLILTQGEMISSREHVRYRDHLKKIQIPVLLVGGNEDSIAPPKALEQVYARLGSADRTLKIFGGENKKATNYGHFDLVLGRDAKAGVFPFIGQWLKPRLARR